MKTKSLIISVSVIIGTSVLLMIYFGMISLGIIKTRVNKLTIKTDSVEVVYNGEEHVANGFIIEEGELHPGHTIRANYTGSQTNVGQSSNAATIAVLDQDLKDVSSIYELTIQFGEISVTPRLITLASLSDSKPFDGTPLTNNKWRIIDGSVAPGQRIEVNIYGNIIEAGTIANELSANIYDSGNLDVTKNYEITYNPGELMVYSRDLTIASHSNSKIYDGQEFREDGWELVSGEIAPGHKIISNTYGRITNAGIMINSITSVVVDMFGRDVSNNYNLTYQEGNLIVYPKAIVIRSGDSDKRFDGTPLFSEKYDVYDDLVGNDKIEYRSLSSITYPGEIENKFDVIVGNNGVDVTRNYEFIKEYGTLTVNKIFLTIVSESDTKVYDGTPLEAAGYQVSNEDLVYHGHNLIVTNEGSITNVGKTENISHAWVLDQNNIDVSNYYEFDIQFGQLEVLESIYSGDGLKTEMDGLPDEDVILTVLTNKTESVYLRDKSFGDYNKEGFDKPVVFRSSGINPISYASMALVDNGRVSNSIEIEFLREQISYLVPYFTTNTLNAQDDTNIFGSYTDKYILDYISYNFFANPNYNLINPQYLIQENTYRDYVYENYLELPESTKFGLLNIAQQENLDPLSPNIIKEVQTYIQNAAEYSVEFKYPENVEDLVLYFLTVLKQGICQHFAAAGVLMYRAMGIPARYVTGYKADAIANEVSEVTNLDAHAWVEIYLDGFGWIPIEVTGGFDSDGPGGSDGSDGEGEQDDKRITLAPQNAAKLYDGTPLIPTDIVTKGFEKFEDLGYKIEVTFGGSQTEIGKSKSRITSFKILDENGNNVSNEFIVLTDLGELHVYQTTLTIKTNDFSKIYDGTNLISGDNFYEIEGELEEGHYLNEVTFNGKQLNVGVSANSVRLVIHDESGNDVTASYALIGDFGNLRVIPREITIETRELVAMFNGAEHTLNEYSVSGDWPLNNHRIEIEIIGRQTFIGTSNNDIGSLEIYNGNINVTQNFKIEIILGKITVNPPF